MIHVLLANVLIKHRDESSAGRAELVVLAQDDLKRMIANRAARRDRRAKFDL